MISLIKHFQADKKYVSEADSFLTQFNKQYPNKSPTQQKEIEEYQHLFYQRDTKTNTKPLT